jgi:hypothetical protein
MFLDRDKFDWETREDAETIARYQHIANDPERLKKAQSCIVDSVNAGKRALGVSVPPPTPGRKNPATIMKLNHPK